MKWSGSPSETEEKQRQGKNCMRNIHRFGYTMMLMHKMFITDHVLHKIHNWWLFKRESDMVTNVSVEPNNNKSALI